MTLSRGFVRNAVTTPLDARLMDMAKVAADASGNPITGVLGPYPSIVSTTAATGPMTVSVAAAEFVCSKGRADGVTLPTNDGATSVSITAAPGSNSRIDVIWVKQQDSTTGDAASTPIFGVTAGTAAASPTKPAIPSGATELATLRVYAGTTASNGGSNTLTNTYQMTAMRGAPIPFRTAAERNASPLTFPDWTECVCLTGGTGGHYFYHPTNGWSARAPRKMVARRTMAATNTFTDQTSYADLPQAADLAAMTLAFPHQANASVVVHIAASVEMTSGVAQLLYFAVNINGTDYEVARLQFPIATVRNQIVGTIEIDGLASGTLTCKPRFKSATAAIVRLASGLDSISMYIEDVTL